MTAPGCRVRDDGRPGPCSLFHDEHLVIDGELIHPVGLDRNGRWTWDEARP